MKVDNELHAWIDDVISYLMNDVTSHIETSHKELEKIDFLWGRNRLDQSIATSNIKADISMEGHLVLYASIEIKLSKARPAIFTNLQQYCMLSQILEFHSKLQAQMTSLSHLKSLLKEKMNDQPVTSDMAVDDTVKFYSEVLEVIHKSISDVCKELRSAGNVLRLPSNQRFPFTPHVDLRLIPLLPSDLIVNFSIHRGELILEVFQIKSSPDKARTIISPAWWTKKEMVGAVCMYRNNQVEIVEYLRTSIALPQIDEMLQQLDTELCTLTSVRDNISALIDCVL